MPNSIIKRIDIITININFIIKNPNDVISINPLRNIITIKEGTHAIVQRKSTPQQKLNLENLGIISSRRNSRAIIQTIEKTIVVIYPYSAGNPSL